VDSVRDVYILSRVTLGADIAVTSVMIDGLKRRFRNATIWLIGDRKSYELFENDSRVGFYPMPFKRGAALYVNLMERLNLKTGLVIDPDSRISQLGLLPICPEENYYFFESRAYGASTNDSLPLLAARWMREVFGVEAKAYIDPLSKPRRDKFITVSFGVGENAAKRVRDPFERKLLEKLAQRGLPVVVDRGAGGEEAERVERAAAGIRGVELHRGSFGQFADLIRQSALYAGYDSAGAHAAAASAVPLMVFFKGAVNDRFFHRWKPTGVGSMDIIRIDDADPDPESILGLVS
jgi:ADP-heptose:LPS heptosyltransferase